MRLQFRPPVCSFFFRQIVIENVFWVFGIYPRLLNFSSTPQVGSNSGRSPPTLTSYQSGASPPNASIKLTPSNGTKALMYANVTTPLFSPFHSLSALLNPSNAPLTTIPLQLCDTIIISLSFSCISLKTASWIAAMSGSSVFTGGSCPTAISESVMHLYPSASSFAITVLNTSGVCQAPGVKMRVGFAIIIQVGFG
jgi:hypothetical protein